jgi:hypothetical protein
MPRLPTLLTTLFALSVILTPVLAVGLERGLYKITHTTIDNKTVFLDSEYGDGEGIQLNLPRTEKNNGQLVRINPKLECFEVDTHSFPSGSWIGSMIGLAWKM